MEHQEAAAAAENPPHVLIYPFPLQSHVTSMLNLAEVLCHAAGGLHVTFLIPENIHQRLQSFTNIQSRFTPFPGFHYEILPDKPQSSSGAIAHHNQPILTAGAFEEIGKYLFRDLMVSSHLRPPVTCIIADGALIYALQVAEELGIPVIFFYTTSASGFWCNFCFPQTIDAGEIPFKGNDDLDLPIQSVPGMEGYLRRRDLPSYGSFADLNQGHLKFVMFSVGQSVGARGLIFNTIEEIEAPILSHIRTRLPNLYTVGPLHTHLKTKTSGESTTSSSNSLWEEDRSCIAWLDAQPPKSVIYVSFGSISTTKKEKLMELWHGLINSGKRFLWAMRPDLVAGDGENQILPVNGKDQEGSNYNIVSWAPQQEVLSHPSVGWFLTHGGWNSILEGLVAGVPLLCWPYLADQPLNSRIVGEVWKVGIDMKDICDRVTIEKMVRELMDARMDEFPQRANSIAELASKAIAEGGSSHCNLNRLISDIKLMSFKSQPTNPGHATV